MGDLDLVFDLKCKRLSLFLFLGLLWSCGARNLNIFASSCFRCSFRPIHKYCWKMQVPSHITKLVLRNNALTTLRGIENLKSLEGLDVSYNIISNFSELEFLVDITSLQNLWLEGNPLCCARWYRAHVFSLFSHPDNVRFPFSIFSFSSFSFILLLFHLELYDFYVSL